MEIIGTLCNSSKVVHDHHDKPKYNRKITMEGPIVSEERYIIDFDNTPLDEAGVYAEELRNELLNIGRGEIQVEKRQADPKSQDFGATLVLVLGAPAVVVLAKGIRDWLARTPNATISIRTPQGEVIATGLKSEDAASIADRLLSQQ